MKIPRYLIGELPQVSQYKLHDGLSGNIETIQIMKRVARERSGHPFIRALALKILENDRVESQNHVDEALALGDFVKRNVIYRRDPDEIEQVQDPIKIATDINENGRAYGDCDDMALFLATLLLSVGARPLFRAIRYDNNAEYYNHIYVVVYDCNYGQPEERIVLDAIMKRNPIGYEVPHESGTEYEI